jgi:hypothetical protein
MESFSLAAFGSSDRRRCKRVIGQEDAGKFKRLGAAESNQRVDPNRSAWGLKYSLAFREDRFPCPFHALLLPNFIVFHL